MPAKKKENCSDELGLSIVSISYGTYCHSERVAPRFDEVGRSHILPGYEMMERLSRVFVPRYEGISQARDAHACQLTGVEVAL